MKIYLVVLNLMLLGACSSTNQLSSLVLDYDEFGPPSAAFEIIGNDWWQWELHGDSQPKKYNIKVVVFKNTNQELLHKQYPIDQGAEKDFRFIHYDTAMTYLDKMIEENAIAALTEKLERTRSKLTKF